MYRRDRVGRIGRGAASLGAIVAAALIPKCPLCVAAALSAIGVGASLGAMLAPIVRPLGFALAVIALAAAARGEWQRRKRLACGGCRRATAPLP